MNKPAIALLALSASLTGNSAVIADSAQDKAIERGNAHYLLFCANCHGINADGNGPLVKLLKVTPNNLTLFRQTNGGQTVMERVLLAVDGRHKVGESAERKMPVFSDNLEIKTVIEIAKYLETIQQ